MSNQISVAQVQQYSTNIMMLLQQQGTRLRPCVTEFAFRGKAASMAEQFGSVNPIRNQGRHSDTPLIGTPQDKRWVFPNDYDWADLVDPQDLLRLIIDPTGPYARAGSMAMGRAMDDEIIAGCLGVNYTGENGTTATSTLYAYNSNSQAVAATTGGSAACGLNVAKLKSAMQILMQSDADLDNDEAYIIVSAKQHTDLLNEVQVTYSDYNGDKPVLVDGKIDKFLGFRFIHSERIPGAANFNTAINPGITSSDADGSYVTGSRWLVPFFLKSGLALGIWNDIQTSVDKRTDKRNAMQVYVTETVGAARLEEKRCGVICCK